MLTTRQISAVLLVLGIGAGMAAEPPGSPESATRVSVRRVPHRGIQPQVVVDDKGVVHLIYYRGDPAAGDLFYVRSTDGGTTFSSPIRVNRQPGSAIAIGNIRGAHLALGRNGRVHVAWNGSAKARPRGPRQATPMLYTRLTDDGTAFEPERNVIQSAFGLDGGGSVAADQAGNVYVTWHAPVPGMTGEENRRVWVAHSADDGKTFAAEKLASPDAIGVCGCCGMRAFADHRGDVYLFYRSVTVGIHRDMYLLRSTPKGTDFQQDKVQEWTTGTCPMSSEAFCESAGKVLAAWETEGQVFFARIDPATGKRSPPIAAPGSTRGRKHPVVAANARGATLLAWTEGMGWNQGGSLAWQVYDRDGTPTEVKGRAEGVPTWSLIAAFARADGSFVILY